MAETGSNCRAWGALSHWKKFAGCLAVALAYAAIGGDGAANNWCIHQTIFRTFRGRTIAVGRSSAEGGYLAESSFISCEARTALTAESSSLVILRRLSA